MSRISREWMFMEIANTVSKRSTCARGANGAVLVFNNNIIGVGYNGPSTNDDHCNNIVCNWTNIWRDKCKRSIHAEVNAIERAYSNLIELDIPDTSLDNLVLSMYVTSSPCLNCTSYILNCHLNIKKIYFQHRYHDINHLVMFNSFNIELFQITPSYKVNYFSGKVEEH